MKNCTQCNWGLTTLLGVADLRFIRLISLFDRTQGRVGGPNAGRNPDMSPQSSHMVYPGELNAMKNCAHCNWGLTTLLGEVDMRFIPLISLIDRTQGRIGGRKTGRLT